MSKPMVLNVDTGSVLVEVRDRNEKIGEFRYNPSDIDIAQRYEQVAKNLEDAKISDNPDVEEVFAFSNMIKDQFDYLLNYKVSDALFAKCNPLTPLSDGEFYCVRVLDGIVKLFEDTTNQRIARKKAKINKATAKYHK